MNSAPPPPTGGNDDDGGNRRWDYDADAQIAHSTAVNGNIETTRQYNAANQLQTLVETWDRFVVHH